MKKILIIKPDHIGDYILFRDFIRDIKKTKGYENSHITCVLNQNIRDLAEYLDKDIIDSFIFIDLQKYIQNDWYTLRQNQIIQQQSYTMIINALYHKFETFETLIESIDAQYKYGLKEDLKESHKEYQAKYEKNYSKLVNISKNTPFIFEGTKELFNKIFSTKMLTKKPIINLTTNPIYDFRFKQNYIVIFIGSADQYRKWSIYNYISLIQYILTATSLEVIICGSNQEYEDALKIENTINDKRLNNLCTQTSLIDMLFIIKDAQLIISNETGIAHISTALNKYTLVISNGNHFGKFTPYPKLYTNKYFGIYPFNIDNDFNELKEKYYIKSSLDINTIKPNDIINILNNILKKIHLKFNRKCFTKEKPYTLPSPYQININYEFSTSFSHLFNEIQKLKEKNESVLTYGNNSLNTLVQIILGKNHLGTLDKKQCSSFELLKKYPQNTIIICLLGREDIVIKYLYDKFGVTPSRIKIFNILKKVHLVRK